MLLVSVNWLRELVDLTLSPEELAHTLTVAGFEVESINDLSRLADGVVVGKVVDCQPHPNADKLRVCQVDLGQEETANIVCGASNVRSDIFVPVATKGTYLPAIDLKIKSSKLRGVRSEGMICSLSELGLAKESEGIKILSGENLQPGADIRPLLGLDDVILEVSSTANRADGLSMVGIAREVAALTGASLRLPSVSIPDIAQKQGLKIQISDSQACPAYFGTVVEGLKISPSPEWLQWRLQGAGVRPINNVVDVTNYILLEWGQPLHAFDRDRLQDTVGSKDLTIGVRLAQKQESLTTLDGQERSLLPENLLITANDQPVALAGVMGGEQTEVHETTENILLEAALFDPVAIRRSSRCQSLRTEASARYERGVNQAELETASARAVELLVELAQGTPANRDFADTRPDQDNWSRSIELRLKRVHQVLGAVKQGELTAADVERILTALNCQLTPTTADTWKVQVPPYRYRDLEREIDLIEEIGRLYGYDNFCNTLPAKTEPGYLPLNIQLQRKLRQAFLGVGLTEVVHYSLTKPDTGEIVLNNPLLSEYSALRTNLIDGLITAFAYNQSQGNGALNAFEIGRIFRRQEDKLAESDAIAGIMGGDFFSQGRWTNGGKNQPMTWFEAKGILTSVFTSLGIEVEYQADRQDERFHPGRTASLWLAGENLGIFGQLHPQLRNAKDLPDAVYLFQLSLAVLEAKISKEGNMIPVFANFSTYPAVERDLAFFAPTEITVAELEQTMKQAGSKLLTAVELFDQYQGENVPQGERSLAFSLSYRAQDRTLTEQEIEPVHQKIRQALEQKFPLTLRS